MFRLQTVDLLYYTELVYWCIGLLLYSRKVHHAPQVNKLAFLGIPLENPLEKRNVENFWEKEAWLHSNYIHKEKKKYQA